MKYIPVLDMMLTHSTFDRGKLQYLALKAVNPDFTTRNGFQWAFPGHWTIDPAATGIYTSNICPTKAGDGLSVARTMRGMADGGYTPHTLLIVGFNKADLLVEDQNKQKVRKAKTLTIVDGLKYIRLFGTNVDLSGANLSEANLRRAGLFGADLRRANLSEAID